VFEPEDLVARLAALVLPPRISAPRSSRTSSAT